MPIRWQGPRHATLEELGEAIARGDAPATEDLSLYRIGRRTAENGVLIADIVTMLAAAQNAGESITPAANWLLDNHYVVEETIVQIRRDLPQRFFAELPLRQSSNVPRVLEIAWHYVAHSDSAISEAGFRSLVEGYQRVQPLRIGELWALPSVLRFVLVENLRRLALRVQRAHRMRDLANRVADRVLAPRADGDDVALAREHAEHARDQTFATQLLHRLRDGSVSAGRALAWLEAELEKAGSDAEETTISEHATLSSGNVTTGNIIRGLRLIDDTQWTDWVESVSLVDRILREQSDFGLLDFASRDDYRSAVEQLARRARLEEQDVAIRAIEAARAAAPGEPTDVGCVLVGPRSRAFEKAIGYPVPLAQRLYRINRRIGWPAMVVPILLLGVGYLWAVAGGLREFGLGQGAMWLLGLLFILPAAEAAIGVYNTVVSMLVGPTRLVGYEYRDGVPPEARTLIAVPTLIGSRDDVEEALHNLEVHYLANMTGALHFALLSDWPDSDQEQGASDLDVLESARKGIAALNARYPSDGPARFHILHRRRVFSEAEGVWMGWERKRGKLHELNTLLRGDRDTTFLDPGEPLPQDIVYVFTVDADTRMTRDAVARLVGKMHHPLNRPILDAAGRQVVSGYAIMQPRVTPSLTTGDEASFFQRIFSANRGIDPYVFAVSDVYQDLFGDGSFTGKGLYHVDAMEAALAGRIPENAVLSHDLLEGAWARAALVTDVELIEDYPTRYLVDASRQHRWARGDWQLLPFILSLGNAIPGLSRWKMIDNLRRSLTPIAWVLASIAGWTVLPFTQAVQWQALLVLSLFLSLTYGLFDSIVPRDPEATLRSHLGMVGRDAAFASAQVVLKVALMAHSAALMADAIVRTLYRLLVSRRHLLEWRTASQAARAASGVGAHYRAMWGAPVIAAAGLVLPLATGSTGVVVGAFFAFLWGASPAFAWLVSRSAETEDRLHITPSDVTALRRVARRTWLYFETFVTAEHNHLPPDNFQESPEPLVAGRTSPTNIGVYLLSVVSARDFGWISLSEAVERIDRTLATIEQLPRHRGHLFNWIDTRSLEPLMPRYVSSVDSGNLSGHLVAVAGACAHWSDAPAAHLQGDFDGILDTAGIVEECLAEMSSDRRRLNPLRRRLQERLDGMRRAVDSIRSQPETAAIRTINLTVLASDIGRLGRALDEEVGSPASATLALWVGKLEEVCAAHLADAHVEEGGVRSLRHRLRDVGERARRFAFEADYSFLLRGDRKLLSIGYRVDERQLDEACYDLLASEARLTSLFAIAKGDLPTDHWFRLGRPVTEIGFQGALVSWSGSMFEYLMPPLVMKEPLGGLLNQSSNLIVRRQIEYGRQKGTPWGVSEAAYNARDREMNYQYTNFGVPGLGLKRGLAHDTVIAPYASLLAAQFRPADAVANLGHLRRIGALGRYGYHDAVDFTPGRVPENARCAVVRNYMAHHAGMSIVAVANAVFEGRMRDRFHGDPVVEAAEILLQEKAPRSIPATAIRPEPGLRVAPAVLDERPDSRFVADPASAPRAIGLMSNGHFNVMLSATGTGYSRADDIQVTRWNGDPTEDRSGTFVFLTDRQTGEWWSATVAPRRAPGEEAWAHFSDDKATFGKKLGGLRTELECVAVSEGNGEARRITILNEGDVDRHLDVTSFAEIALAREPSDAAHPAFSKMFVETEIAEDGAMIFATRRRRSEGDPPIALAHFVTSDTGMAREVQAETDRRVFIGRGRTIADAAAFDRDARLGGNAGFVLDPVMALRCRVRVPAAKKVSLTFWTIVAANRTDVAAEARRFTYPESFERQAMLAWTRSQVQTRYVGLSLSQAAGVQKLARYILYPDPALRQPAEAIAAGLGPQSALWPTSISGDFPIMALRIGDVSDLEIVASALRMQEYLRARNLVFDLVIVNEQAASYVQDLQQAIESLCENFRLRGHELGPRQHIFAVRRDLMDERAYSTLLAAACVALHTRNGPILDQIERAEAAVTQQLAPRDEAGAVPPPLSPRRPEHAPPVPDGAGLELWNGYGGFAEGGRAYVVRLRPGESTPQPWINVVANEGFGFHVSAEGSAFTWSRNSRDYQVTPWSNDPVSDRPGEGFYVADLDAGTAFSPLACLLPGRPGGREASFEAGLCRFSGSDGGIDATLEQLVDAADPVKLSRLTLVNRSAGPRRLRVYAYAEWVLGQRRSRTAPWLVPGFDRAAAAITARNPYGLEYGGRTAFLSVDAEDFTHTSDRAEFIGQGGSSASPEAVLRGASLSGRVEAGRDTCAALACDVELRPGETRSLVFALGDADGPSEAATLARRHLDTDFDGRISALRTGWDGFFETLQVETPDPAFDVMVNRWLPYQSLACRVRARAAFYQASGAFGFRDQLQDTLSLMLHEPGLARAQILNAAQRQFREGDVQHWWLPRNGAGVRTMISDDVVWLAYGAHLYVTTTGDEALYDVELPFLEGPALEPGQHDAFFVPDISRDTVSLYEHCARALDLAVARTGANGLPLILGGDWNDGMNRVGEAGRGTSVWLGWFLLKALTDFIPVARSRGDKARVAKWRQHAAALKQAIETNGWDGEWYLRGTFDDGSPLGSARSDECRIDSIAQSWAVLSGEADPERAAGAVDQAVARLVDDGNGIVRLFDPPFHDTDKEPGYIKSYPPGVRENGGQYTHAATWLVIALARLGRADEAYRLLSMINPASRVRDREVADRYRVEPYAVAADIYAGDKAGRGGWTWYTGSSGWLYRACVEAVLGISRRGDRLHVSPVLPTSWDGYRATVRLNGTSYRVTVQRGMKPVVEIDGQPVSTGSGQHSDDQDAVTITLA